MEAIFRKQVVQVIAGDATRNIGILLAHQIAVLITNTPKAGVDVTAPVPRGNDGIEVSLAGLPNTQAESAIGKHFEFFDVLVSLARHHRMNAAGIVADHPTERAAAVAGGIRTKCQVVLFRGGAEMVEHNAGLHASDPALGVELEDVSHVLREVEDDGDVTALAREGSPAAAAEHRNSMLATGGDGGDNVIVVARKNYAYRYLAVIGAVTRVKRTASIVETNFPVDALAQDGVKRR